MRIRSRTAVAAARCGAGAGARGAATRPGAGVGRVGSASGGGTIVGASSRTIRRTGGGGLSSMRSAPALAGDEVDGEVQRDDDEQQHECRRVSLVVRVALAGGG